MPFSIFSLYYIFLNINLEKTDFLINSSKYDHISTSTMNLKANAMSNIQFMCPITVELFHLKTSHLK